MGLCVNKKIFKCMFCLLRSLQALYYIYFKVFCFFFADFTVFSVFIILLRCQHFLADSCRYQIANLCSFDAAFFSVCAEKSLLRSGMTKIGQKRHHLQFELQFQLIICKVLGMF